METRGLMSNARGFPLGRGGGGLPWEMWTGLVVNLSHSLGMGNEDLQVLFPAYQ